MGYRVKNNTDLMVGLRSYYHYLVNVEKLSKSVSITLPIDKWISANGLNILLVFIESLLKLKRDLQIYVELVDNDISSSILNSDTKSLNDVPIVNLIDKLIYYESMNLLPMLREKGVIVIPQKTIYDRLKLKLDAYKTQGAYMYSSRMLSLNPLVEGEEAQHLLTTRMRTLQSILYQNMYLRIEASEIKKASHQIMFELVKNIYQHSEVDTDDNNPKGYACAQINPYPLIKHASYPLSLCASVLEYRRPAIRGKRWKMLSITINDFGIGIIRKMKKDLREKLRKYKSIYIGNQLISEELINDSAKLIELALTSDYSSKKVRERLKNKPTRNEWTTQDAVIKLESNGYGLVYCMSFIAQNFGRMRIRSNDSEVEVYAKADTALKSELFDNTVQTASLLQKDFRNYFDVIIKQLNEKESNFPGTQILIEVPVEAWHDRQK